MKIRVDSFHEGWVRFSCELGSGEAKWKSDAPEAFRDYHVELALEDPVEVKAAVAQVPLLDADRERCLLRGLVEQASDGASVLRVGPTLVSIDGIFSGWLAVRASALLLFDENI
jgi:hypothetical protein